MVGAGRWGVAFLLALLVAQDGLLREYVDPAGRFRFQYPAAFGATSPGTNDGFADRVAAIRFDAFSSGRGAIGGEAALTRGTPVLDIQAAGGLYDPITLEVFPAAMRQLVVTALPALSVANVCDLIARQQHLDLQSPALTSFSPAQKSAIAGADGMRNVSPRVIQCRVDGPTVTFDKEAAFQPGGPRQHVYGAIRFLDPPFSTFQIVRAGSPPDQTTLEQMAALVKSWARR